jgi:hypothetical protein
MYKCRRILLIALLKSMTVKMNKYENLQGAVVAIKEVGL